MKEIGYKIEKKYIKVDDKLEKNVDYYLFREVWKKAYAELYFKVGTDVLN